MKWILIEYGILAFMVIISIAGGIYYFCVGILWILNKLRRKK